MSSTAAPDAQHWHRAVPAVQRLLEYAPSSGSLALWVRHLDVDAGADDAQRAMVSTDGECLYYASAFVKLPLPLQSGWVAHGVLHVALRHVPRMQALRAQLGDVDAQLFNLCADAIVNTALSHHGWLALPADAVLLERLLLEVLGVDATAQAALKQWDVERLYRAVDDRHAAQRRGLRSAGSEGGGGTPQRVPPPLPQSQSAQGQDAVAGASPRQDGPRAARLRLLGAHVAPDLKPGPQAWWAPEAEADASRDWHERLLRAHAGDGTLSLLRSVPADLPRAHTPWEQVLRVYLARGLARRSGPSWSRPARSYIANQGRTRAGRRLPWEPGTTSEHRAPRLALVVDVSGSIDPRLLGRLASELAAITRRQEAPTLLVMGDNQVQHVQHCAPGQVDLAAIAFSGGGGTDFRPLLEEAQRHRPDVIVVLTDLDGPSGPPPRAPVLWAVPDSMQPVDAPFGRLLRLR